MPVNLVLSTVSLGIRERIHNDILLKSQLRWFLTLMHLFDGVRLAVELCCHIMRTVQICFWGDALKRHFPKTLFFFSAPIHSTRSNSTLPLSVAEGLGYEEVSCRGLRQMWLSRPTDTAAGDQVIELHVLHIRAEKSAWKKRPLFKSNTLVFFVSVQNSRSTIIPLEILCIESIKDRVEPESSPAVCLNPE